MTTQVDPTTQSDKSSANSLIRGSKRAQPEIISHTVVKSLPPTEEQPTDEQRRKLIALEAYYLAEKRSFQPGHEEEDWLAAEVLVATVNPPEP